MTPTADALLGEVTASLDRIQQSLLARLGAEDVSQTARVPFNVLMCREVLSRRLLEISRSAMAALALEQFATTSILTRAAVETASVLWFLGDSVESAVRSESSEQLAARVKRLVHGSRTTPEAPLAITVLNCVDAVDKKLEGVRQAYDMLSELAHPNWAGSLHLYGRPNLEARECVFGPSADAAELRLRNAALLSGTCLLAESSRQMIADQISALVALCEREVRASAS